MALLPTPGDPFLVRYWLANYATWREEVDGLTVLVNGESGPDVIEYLRTIIEAAGGTMLTAPRMLGHGEALGILVESTNAEHLLLCEDDAYIRRPGAVDDRFRRIERGELDIIGTPRGSASMELIGAANEVFGPDVDTPSGEVGPSLWPCFVFTRRSILRATDRNYAARRWPAGTVIPGIGRTFPVEVSADTFGSTSYQLRARGRRIGWESNFRATTFGSVSTWMQHLDPPWFHIGSLSVGYGNLFGTAPIRIDTSDLTGFQEWTRRLHWWLRFERTADDTAIPHIRARYRQGLEDVREGLGQSQSLGVMLALWEELYAPWITWAES